MSVRMRHTKSHSANRRSHHALTAPRLTACASCGAFHLRHRVCMECGQYRGKSVVDTTKKAEKRLAKLQKAQGQEAEAK